VDKVSEIPSKKQNLRKEKRAESVIQVVESLP
jgi:hypothetical protein